MGKIEGNEVFSESLIKAPLELNKNIEVLLKTVERLVVGLKQAESTMAKSEGSKKVDQANKKRKQTLTELQKVEVQIQKTREKSTQKFIEQKAALDRANKANRERTKTLNENIALENKQLGTLEKLALVNKKLTDERKKLNLETDKGQKRLKAINIQLDKNNKKIKDNNDALGKQKINIGNYKDAISGLPGPLGQAARATNMLTGSALKFIATPIGAVIAALGLALGALTSFFKTSEEGQNALTKVTAAASVVWDNMLDIVSNLGKALFSLIKGDFAGMREAFNDATDGVKNFVAETQKDIAIQNRISDLRAKNIKLQRELTVEEAKLMRKSNELREQAAEVEETNAARAVELAKMAFEVEDELARKRTVVAQNRIEILKTEATLANSTIDVLDEIASAEASLENIQGRRAKRARTILKEINSLERKAATQAKDRVKLEVDSFAEIEAKAPSEEEKLDLLFPTTDAIKERLDANLELYKKNQEELRKIDQESQDQRNQIIGASVNLSKEIFGGFTDLRIQQIGQELEFIEFSRDRELEKVKGNKRAEKAVNADFDRKKRELEKKQLNAQKANALFQIALNTALAISAANALIPPANIPAIIFAAAVGATQAAVVLAQQVPQFDSGSESTPKDYIAGEKRPELRKSGGKWSLVDKPTLFGNSPGDTIIGGSETDNILGKLADLSGPNLLSNTNFMGGLETRKERNKNALMNEILRSNKSLERTIKNKPSANISVSRSRMDVKEKHGNTWVNRLDARYKGRV